MNNFLRKKPERTLGEGIIRYLDRRTKDYTPQRYNINQYEEYGGGTYVDKRTDISIDSLSLKEIKSLLSKRMKIKPFITLDDVLIYQRIKKDYNTVKHVEVVVIGVDPSIDLTNFYGKYHQPCW